mmetsp:Transcript_5711/g.8651  ORF Transcript_5711/g.8651 Transcript_5711/m.8651 type:complete len:210 (+) Transcript_5711:182-811(+)
MKFVKAAAIVLGCLYPPEFFAKAAGGAGGATGYVIQEIGLQGTAKRRTNRSVRSPERQLQAKPKKEQSKRVKKSKKVKKSKTPSTSLLPSSQPSGAPSLSKVPSEVPSSGPSLSGMPSIKQSSFPSVSVLPSAVPTNGPNGPSVSLSPSKCVDDDSWEAARNGVIVKCDSAFPETLCGYFSQSIYISNGKTAAEACCLCGGSTHRVPQT